jgi:hypothetical protein
MASGSSRSRPFEFKWPDPPPGSHTAEDPSVIGPAQKPILPSAPAPTARNKKAAYNFSWDRALEASSTSQISTRMPDAGTLTPPTEKRGRGRPRKNPLVPVQGTNVAQAAPAAVVKNLPDKQNSPEKRGRGRPKKISQELPQSLSNGSSSDDRGGTLPDISGKRGRGRPKKAPPTQDETSAKASIDGQPQADSATVEEKRPRGRPKKVGTVGQPDLPNTATSQIANNPPEATSSPGELTTAPIMEAFTSPSMPVELPLLVVPPEAQESKATPSGRPLDAASVFANFGAPSDGHTEELPETLADDEELIAIEQKLRAMFNHEPPQSLVRPTHEKKSFLVPANARRENIEVTKRGTYGTQKRLVAVERVGATIDTGTRQEEMQKIAAHPLFPECVKLIVLDQRLKDADAQGALKLRWRMERLRRLLSEVDLRVRNILDLVNERSRALA